MKNKQFKPILSPEIEDSFCEMSLTDRFKGKNNIRQGVRPHPNRANILAELIAHGLDTF